MKLAQDRIRRPFPDQVGKASIFPTRMHGAESDGKRRDTDMGIKDRKRSAAVLFPIPSMLPACVQSCRRADCIPVLISDATSSSMLTLAGDGDSELLQHRILFRSLYTRDPFLLTAKNTLSVSRKSSRMRHIKPGLSLYAESSTPQKRRRNRVV